VPLETRHVAGLGLFGSDAAYDYRWLPGLGQTLATTTARVILQTVITTRALRPVTVAYIALLPFRIAFANFFYAQGLGGSRLQQWDENVLVSIRMGDLSNLGFLRRC